MSGRHGSFIGSLSEAADIPTVRDPRDAPHVNYSPDHESERAASESARRAAATGMQILREDIRCDNREAAFRRAIRRLQLTPEQITARVAELFPVPEQPEDETATAAPAEDEAAA